MKVPESPQKCGLFCFFARHCLAPNGIAKQLFFMA
jgi:hypothetical protein